jgi:hypothetical protein
MKLSNVAAAHRAPRAVRKERTVVKVIKACEALYAAKKAKGPDTIWVPELGPCNSWERQLAKELVAERITYDAAMGAWFQGVQP